MKLFKTLIPLFITTSSISAPAILTVGPASDTDCQFNTIQNAVDSNYFNLDIRVSNQLTTNNGVYFTDDNISSLSGGYLNCNNASNGIIDIINPYTTISNNFDGLENVISVVFYDINSPHTLNISRFNIINGNKGIDLFNADANAEVTVNLDSVNIYDNINSGLVANGTGLSVNYDNGSIYNNTNTGINIGGGGVTCSNAEIAFGESTAVYNNVGIYGGGIYANNCNITLESGDNRPIGSLLYGIFDNSSQKNGGGVYLKESNFIGYSTSLTHPISISNNTANIYQDNPINYGKGGAFYLTSGSTMQIGNPRIDNNMAATKGAAIGTEHLDNSLNSPQLLIVRTLEGCTYNPICSTINNNGFSQANGKGAVISQDGPSEISIWQTQIDSNGEENTLNIFDLQSQAQLSLASILVTNNKTLENIFDLEDQSGLFISYSTFADNLASNYFNIQYDNDNPQLLEVIGTIIKNGAATIANLNNDDGNHDAQVKCSLVEIDDSSGVVQDQSITGIPNFIGSNNYQLQSHSVAIDSDCTNIDQASVSRYDLLGKDRNEQVLAATGSADLGAYEFSDLIFKNDFE